MLLDFNHWTLRNPERGRDLLDVFSKEELLALLAPYALSNDSRFVDARTPVLHGSDKHDSTVCAASDPRLLTTLDSRGRVFSSLLPNVATALTLTSGVAYFVYLGRTVGALTPKHVEFYVSTAGSGTQTAEAGFPFGWKFVGSAVPANIAANKTALLHLWSFGTQESDIVAHYLVES